MKTEIRRANTSTEEHIGLSRMVHEAFNRMRALDDPEPDQELIDREAKKVREAIARSRRASACRVNGRSRKHRCEELSFSARARSSSKAVASTGIAASRNGSGRAVTQVIRPGLLFLYQISRLCVGCRKGAPAMSTMPMVYQITVAALCSRICRQHTKIGLVPAAEF